MFNLLPEQDKVALRSEYSVRRAIVYIIGFIGLVLFAIALLAPVYIVAFYREASDTLRFTSTTHDKDAPEVTYISDIKRLNSMIAILKDDRSVTTGFIFSKIVDAKPAGVTLTTLGFDKSSAGPISIQVQGVARDRESLRDFTKELGQVKGFAVAELPISQFVQESHIPFSLSISFTP